MSWTTGTATGLMDFMDKLRNFLCDQGHAWGKTYAGTGNGTLTNYLGTATSVAEMFTITATSATNFTVVGSVTGSLGAATVGTPYTSAKINFTLTAGGTAFVSGDQFTLQTTPAWQNIYYRGCVSGGAISENRVGSNFDTSTSYPITNMFNGDSSNYAQSYGVPAYVNIKLHNAQQVGQVYFLPASVNECPSSVSLSYSDDGSTYTVLQTWTGLSVNQAYVRKDLVVTSPEAHQWWRVTFNAAPSNYVRIAELVLYREGNTNTPLSDYFRYYFSGPGLDGTKQINISGHIYQDVANDIHNTIVTTYNSQVIPLNNQPFTYHIIANGQRFIISASPSGVWVSGYFGYCLPYEPPSIQGDPYVLAGCSDSWSQDLADTTSELRAFFSPGINCLVAKYPDTGWRYHANRYNSGSTSDGSAYPTSGKVYPWSQGGGQLLTVVREQLDGGFPLIPGVIHYHDGGVYHVLGEFDGVYYTPGFNNSAGTTISYGGFDHLVIKNITRNNPQDFAALRLD